MSRINVNVKKRRNNVQIVEEHWISYMKMGVEAMDNNENVR